jgi:hypothetical protein
VSPRYPLAARAVAALVVVGAPLAAATWLLAHWRHLWGAIVDALHQPWGQVAAFGMALMLAVEVVERPLSHIELLPRNFAEEVLEFVAALCIFVGLAARRRDISKTDNDQAKYLTTSRATRASAVALARGPARAPRRARHGGGGRGGFHAARVSAALMTYSMT